MHICADTAHRALNAQLQIQLTNMTTIATSRTSSVARSKSLVGPLQPLQPKKNDVNKLVIPCVPEELDSDDYQSVRFWTQIGWNNHKKH